MAAPDIAIIGGGICGTSLAAFLAERGASVVLYEEAGIAAGASGRNSGVVQHPFDPALVAIHKATLDEYRVLAATGAGRATGFEFAARPAGLLYVSHEADGVREMAAAVSADQPELGAAYLDEDEVRLLEPSIAPGVSACRLDIGYPVPPAVATRAFGAAARDAGAAIELGRAAVPWLRAGRAVGVRLGTTGQRRPAGAVVVAAGPWSPALIDPSGTWRPIVSRWGVIVEVELADPPGHVLEEAEIERTIEPGSDGGGAGAGGAGATGAAGVAGSVAFSLVTAAGRSAIGSTFLADEPDPAAWAGALLDRAAAFVPATRDAARLGVRACARPVALDGRPLVGAVPGIEGAWLLAGHGPWGISTGPGSARLLADRILGGLAPLPEPLDPARFGRP